MTQKQRAVTWVPSFGAWWKAAKLAIPAYCCATVIFAFNVWRFFLLGGIFVITGSGLEGLGFGLLFSLGILFLSLIWFILWSEIYTFLLKVLWSNPPQWLKLPTNSTMAKRDFSILTLSTLPITVLFLVYVAFNVSLRQEFLSAPSLRLTYDAFLLKFSWLWFISAACLYQQWDRVVLSRSRASRRSSSQPIESR